MKQDSNREEIADKGFPVSWRHQKDETRFWVHDRLHYPDILTPLDFSLVEDDVDKGLGYAAHSFGIPITIHDRHMNGYLYVAVESDHSHCLEPVEQLDEVQDRLRAMWDQAWLPEIKSHLEWWDSARPTNGFRSYLDESLARWERLWQIHFLLFVPSMLAISQFGDLRRVNSRLQRMLAFSDSHRLRKPRWIAEPRFGNSAAR